MNQRFVVPLRASVAQSLMMVALVAAFSPFACAQSKPTPDTQIAPPGVIPTPTTPPDSVGKPSKPPQLGRIIPDAPLERAKLLDDLYAHLATAPDEEASKPFAEAIERLWLSPGSDTVTALIERAVQASGQQRNDLALQLLSAVVELAPDYAEGWNRRAYIFYTEGDYERALGDLRRVLALDANHYKALDGVGQIMRQLDRKPQALRAYEKLLSVHPFWSNVQSTVDELRREVDGRAL